MRCLWFKLNVCVLNTAQKNLIHRHIEKVVFLLLNIASVTKALLQKENVNKKYIFENGNMRQHFLQTSDFLLRNF